MLSKTTLVALITCTTVAYAGSEVSKLVGRWLYNDIDAEAILTFQRDHTCVQERTGFDYHDSEKATWRIDGNRLTIVWQNGEKTTYTIARLTSQRLVLRSKVAGKETFSRLK
jgi:hypothetical protein